MRLSCPEQMLGERPLEAKLNLIRASGFDAIDCRFATLEAPGAALKLREVDLPVASVFSQARTPSLLDRFAVDRAQAITDVVDRARVAAEVGAINLILVPIFGASRLRDSALDPGTRALEEALLIVALKEIDEQLSDTPITVVVEPLNAAETHFLTVPIEAADICKRVQGARIATMVDTYHCFQERLDIPGQIWGVGQQLALVHASDSARGLPGEGEVDFDAVRATLAAVGYDGWVGFECRQVRTSEDEAALARSVALVRGGEGRTGEAVLARGQR